MPSREQRSVRASLTKLITAQMHSFPDAGQSLNAPDRKGVYVIYDPKGRVVHVGRTPKGKRGLFQRLNNHLHGASSFTIHYLKGRGAKLRRGFKYRYLVVTNARKRALLESLASGTLCPAHLGLNEK